MRAAIRGLKWWQIGTLLVGTVSSWTAAVMKLIEPTNSAARISDGHYHWVRVGVFVLLPISYFLNLLVAANPAKQRGQTGELDVPR